VVVAVVAKREVLFVAPAATPAGTTAGVVAVASELTPPAVMAGMTSRDTLDVNAVTGRDVVAAAAQQVLSEPAGASGRAIAATSFEAVAKEVETISPIEAITASNLEVESASPSARFIAANFAAVQAIEPTSVPLLAVSHGFESRALPARSAVEPLQQISPPGEARRSSRYLAAMVSMTFDERAPRTTERAASRISPDELYDQVRRFGTRQGGLNVKF
jgi:hypothetical protein